MVLSKKIEVRGSKIAGHGLYCTERIEKDEVVSADNTTAAPSAVDFI
jgi:hypothetical protein